MYCQSCGASLAHETAFCTNCGRPIAGYAVGRAAGATPPQPDDASTAAQPGSAARSYAGFWLRVVAAFIDSMVLIIPMAPIAFLVFAGAMPAILRSRGNRGLIMTQILPHLIAFFLLVVLVRWLYWSLMESSEWQATLGKRAMGLFVTDLAGSRASFAKTTGRFFAGRGLGSVPILGLGSLYYLIDCICAGLTDQKQAIHDMIAGCLVMRKP